MNAGGQCKLRRRCLVCEIGAERCGLTHVLHVHVLVELLAHILEVTGNAGVNQFVVVLQLKPTDQAFVHEPTVVWERLEDIDGGSSSYFDANFVRSSPPGGDVMGQTAEEALFAAELLADPQAQAE